MNQDMFMGEVECQCGRDVRRVCAMVALLVSPAVIVSDMWLIWLEFWVHVLDGVFTV